MSDFLTQEEVIKNENNRTLSPVAARDYAINHAMFHLKDLGVDVERNIQLTNRHQPGQLSLSVKSEKLTVVLRANAAYLHNSAGMVGVPECADDLDLLIIVTPANPSSQVTGKRYLFIPRWKFAGKKTLYINRADKLIWQGPEALLAIASKFAREYEASQHALLKKLSGKKISKAANAALAKNISEEVSSGVDDFLSFQLYPD